MLIDGPNRVMSCVRLLPRKIKSFRRLRLGFLQIFRRYLSAFDGRCFEALLHLRSKRLNVHDLLNFLARRPEILTTQRPLHRRGNQKHEDGKVTRSSRHPVSKKVCAPSYSRSRHSRHTRLAKTRGVRRVEKERKNGFLLPSSGFGFIRFTCHARCSTRGFSAEILLRCVAQKTHDVENSCSRKATQNHTLIACVERIRRFARIACNRVAASRIVALLIDALLRRYHFPIYHRDLSFAPRVPSEVIVYTSIVSMVSCRDEPRRSC